MAKIISLPLRQMELFRAPPEDFLVSSAASSMWTLLAVLTAAVGLWRIRSVASKPDDAPSPIAYSSPPPPALPTHPVEEIGTTKQRFTMVFALDSADEEGCECGGIVCEENRNEEEEFAGGEEADGHLVVPLELTEWRGVRSDFGFYRYQDRMAINGSVVRLWCGGLRRRV